MRSAARRLTNFIYSMRTVDAHVVGSRNTVIRACVVVSTLVGCGTAQPTAPLGITLGTGIGGTAEARKRFVHDQHDGGIIDRDLSRELNNTDAFVHGGRLHEGKHQSSPTPMGAIVGVTRDVP